MRYLISLLAIWTLLVCQIIAQISPNHYLVNLKDKKESKYSINKPEEFLSKRAIDRRIRYKIPIDEKDIPVNQKYIIELKALGLKIHNISRWTNSVVVYTEDTLLIESLPGKLSFVKSVGFQKISKNQNPKNLLQKSPVNQFGIQSIDSVIALKYGQSFNQIKMHNGHLMHQDGFQGQGMHVAILDGGFYKVNVLPAFDSLRTHKQILGVRDFVKDTVSIFNASDHGMKVLSTMAGNIPGQLIGTAPKAKYWLIRTEHTATEYMIEEFNWVVGAEFADSVGVDVINSSLGYNVFDDKINSHAYIDMDGNSAISSIGADIAASKGMLIVVSAGNEGADQWKYITSPADADSVLTVGGVMQDGRLAYFSSRGPTSDSRIKPDVCAIGLSPAVSGTSGNVSFSSGTSFSSPIMAGLVTILWQAHPELSNMEIIEIVRRCSSMYNKPDNSFGYGIPDIYAAHMYLKSTGSVSPVPKKID
jgi:subtilisin family serine protease